MASIYKDKSPGRTLPWCVAVKGQPRKFFKTRQEAQEHGARANLATPAQVSLARSVDTVADLLTRYSEEVSVTKRGAAVEPADSGDVAQAFRDDVAHRNGVISPIIPT